MSMTDEEKLAAIDVPYEPEKEEHIYLLVQKRQDVTKPAIIGVFTEPQKEQAYVLARDIDRTVVLVKANRLLDGGVNYEG